MTRKISLCAITRNPKQPRAHFDAKKLAELAASIKENGLKQPITVRPIPQTEDGAKYMIVMGERRYRAHLLLQEQGLIDKIECHVREMGDAEMMIDAIIENDQRVDVSPMEQAIAYQKAMDQLGMTVEELAKKLGILQPWRIVERTQLLGLTADNRQLLEQGVVSATQAFHMAPLSPNGQQRFLQMVKLGLASSNKAAEECAAAIRAKEDQMGFDMPEDQPRPKKSIKPVEDRILALGQSLMPLFKDGPFVAPNDLDTSEAQRCIEQIRLIKGHLGQIERELNRAASVSAVG